MEQTRPSPSLIRPPILQATRLIGITDAQVASLMGIAPMVVSQWANAQRPIPRVRHYALVFFVLHLEGTIGLDCADPARSLYAARARVAQDMIITLVNLTFDEIGDIPDALTADAEAMAAAMIKKLEAKVPA